MVLRLLYGCAVAAVSLAGTAAHYTFVQSRIREKNTQERQLQQQKELLDAAREACIKVQKDHEKKEQEEMRQLGKEGVAVKKEEQQQLVNGGVTGDCNLSNADAAKLLKNHLSQRVKEETSTTAKVEAAGEGRTKQETEEPEEEPPTAHTTTTPASGGLKEVGEATVQRTTAAGVTEKKEEVKEEGCTGSLSVVTQGDVKDVDAAIVDEATLKNAAAPAAACEAVQIAADNASCSGSKTESHCTSTTTAATAEEECEKTGTHAGETHGMTAETEAADVDSVDRKGEAIPVAQEKEEEEWPKLPSEAGEEEPPPSKRARVIRKKKKAAGKKQQPQQQEKAKIDGVTEEKRQKKQETEVGAGGLFDEEDEEKEEEEEEEEKEDVKVIRKSTKEENYDLFKSKLTERLGSTREVEGSLLLQDAVEGGIGCNNRSSWRLLYYQYKFHLPSAAVDASSTGRAGSDSPSSGAAVTAGVAPVSAGAASTIPTITTSGDVAAGARAEQGVTSAAPAAASSSSCGLVSAAVAAGGGHVGPSPSRVSTAQQRLRSESSVQAAATAGEIDKLAGEVARMYLIGLQWVLYYYYQGCRSFAWFYPFHYAPLAVDLAVELHRQHAAATQKQQRHKQQQPGKKTSKKVCTSPDQKSPSKTTLEDSQSSNNNGSSNQGSTTQDINSEGTSNASLDLTTGQKQEDENTFFKVEFDIGEPFSAFEQLMAVLPPYSAGCMPEAHAELMRDPLSPIADFYPLDVEMDPNGKRYQWQWVVLLPFIDEERLLRKCKMLERTLTAEERMRNRRGHDQLYVHRSHPLAVVLSDVHHAGARTQSTAPFNGTAAFLESEKYVIEMTEIPKEEGQQIPEDKGSGFTGKLLFHPFAVQPGHALESPIRGLPRLLSAAFCCRYTPLNLQQPHRSVMLEGAKPYEAVLDKVDLQDQERRDRSFSGAVARRIVMHTLQSNYRNTGSNAHMRNAGGYPFCRGGDGNNRGPLLRFMPDVHRIPCDSATGAYYPGAGGVPHPPPHMLQHPGGYPMPPLLPLPAHMNAADARGAGGLRGNYYMPGAGLDLRMLGLPPAGVPAMTGRASVCYNRAGQQQQYAPMNPPPPYPQQQQQQSRQVQQAWHVPPQQHPLLPFPNPGQEAAKGWRAASGGRGGVPLPFPDGTDTAQTAGFRRGGEVGPIAAGSRGLEIGMGKKAQGRREWGWDGRQQVSGCPGVLGAPPANYNAYDTLTAQQQRSQQQPGLLHWAGGIPAAGNVLPGDPWMQQYTATNTLGACFSSQAILPHQQQTQFGQVQGGQSHMWNVKPRTDVAGGWWSAAAAGQRGVPTGRRNPPVDARAQYGTMKPR